MGACEITTGQEAKLRHEKKGIKLNLHALEQRQSLWMVTLQAGTHKAVFQFIFCLVDC